MPTIKLIKTESQKPAADKTYAFSVKLKPGLIKYKVEFGAKTGDTRDGAAHGRQPGLRRRLPDRRPIQCGGDRTLASGRPARTPASGSAVSAASWRATPPAAAGATRSAADRQGGKAPDRLWGMDLARRLVENQKIPICIINGAVGGTPIDQHQRNPAEPDTTRTHRFTAACCGACGRPS